jgi:D-glycero-D-manno-heptose 1,7-bisphosphate phosphatase
VNATVTGQVSSLREGIIRISFTQSPRPGSIPAIFLDRDGVINERIFGSYVADWLGFKFIPGISKALAQLAALKLPLIVISNQAGVGKKLVTRESLEEITHRFVSELNSQGVFIDAVYYCPHRPDEGCKCRKPAPGLLLQAASDWHLDLRRSVFVGDSESDLDAAKAAGCRSISFRHASNPSDMSLSAARSVTHDSESLSAAVRLLLRDLHADRR